MNKILEINGTIYKQFRNTSYYVNKFGVVYSTISNKFIKPLERYVKEKCYHYMIFMIMEINIICLYID